MHRSSLWAIAACTLLLPAALSAQKPDTGKWTGRVSPPTEEARDVVIEVSVSGDTVKGVLTIPALVDFPPVMLVDLKLSAEGKLTFGFEARQFVKCELSKGPEGNFSGTCGPEGDIGAAGIVLNPPRPVVKTSSE